MRKGTKFGVVTGFAAGVALASGAWVMFPLWTALSVVGTHLLNKRDDNPYDINKMSPQVLQHIHTVIYGKK